MDFESLTPEQRLKAKAAQTPDELEALCAEAGQALTDDQLEAVSGGYSCPALSPLLAACPDKRDTLGHSCVSYQFM